MRQLAVMCLLVSLVLAVALFGMPIYSALVPSGATVTPGTNSTAPMDTPTSHGAIAGNVTSMTMTGFTTTQAWQGYFGNITGTVQLADSSDNVMYNWSLNSPEGEVYAARFANISWQNIQCLNFSATGAGGAEAGTRGATSQTGRNLTQLEAQFNIASDDIDGYNETFGYNGSGYTGGSLPNNAGSHDTFYTNNLEFSTGECLSTNLFRQGSGQDNYFEEILLYDPANFMEVFVALIEEGREAGFDSVEHDFQMIVPDDGHGTDTSPTTYYFYMEIE